MTISRIFELGHCSPLGVAEATGFKRDGRLTIGTGAGRQYPGASLIRRFGSLFRRINSLFGYRAGRSIVSALDAGYRRAFGTVLDSHITPQVAGGYAGIPMRPSGTRISAPTKVPPTTQHGANRLAIIGLSVLTCAPITSGNRVQLSVIGGAGRGDRFSLAWPIWTTPASLAAIRALLSHPKLREPRALEHLGVNHVRVTRRVSLDRLRDFTCAEPLEAR